MTLLTESTVELFSDIERNKDDTSKFLCHARVAGTIPGLVAPEGYELIVPSYGNTTDYRLLKDNGEACLTKDNLTCFNNELTVNYGVTILPYAATEKDAWWDMSLPRTSAEWAMAERVFAYRLNRFGNYQPGPAHSEGLKAWWVEKVIDALGKGQYVYVLSRQQYQCCTYDEVLSAEEFVARWVDYIWGTDPLVHPYRSVMISTTKLNIHG